MTTMSQNLGRILPNPRGAFSLTAQYYELDEVTYGFQIYRVRKNVTPPVGSLPTNTLYFFPTNFYNPSEVSAIDRYSIVSLPNQAIPIDVSSYDALVLELNLQLSAASSIYIDTGANGVLQFPANSSYAGYYDSNNNYDEILLTCKIYNYNIGTRKTKIITSGAGFTANVVNNPGINAFVAANAEMTNAINIVGLNGANLTGSIILKKIKYFI